MRPSATATFLFTDIEGSTQLLTRLRERYADLLAEHHRLLRAIFAEHGGQEIDTRVTPSSSRSRARRTP